MNKIKVKNGLWMIVSHTNHCGTSSVSPWIDFYNEFGDWIGSWDPISTKLDALTYNVSGVTCLRDVLSHF